MIPVVAIAGQLGGNYRNFTDAMAYADTLPPQRKFGQTTRPDSWWLQPLVVFLGFSAFIVYSTWAAFQGVGDMKHGTCSYWFGGNARERLSLAVLLAGILGHFASRHWQTATSMVAGMAPPVLTGIFDNFCGFRAGVSGSPAIIIAEPITRRSGPTRSTAPWANRARRFWANGLSR